MSSFRTASDMPSAVKAFAVLYGAATAFQLAICLRFVSDWSAMSMKERAVWQSAGGLTFFIVAFSLFVVVPVLMTWLAASKRQNWARIVLAVMFAIGTWSGLTPVGANVFSKFDFATVRFLVLTALQTPALCLIFSPAAKTWFARAELRFAHA